VHLVGFIIRVYSIFSQS